MREWLEREIIAHGRLPLLFFLLGSDVFIDNRIRRLA